MRAKWPPLTLPVVLLLIASFLLSAIWAFATPIPVGADDSRWGNFFPDEGSHRSVIEYTAEHHRLPPYRIPYDTSVHPPFYHSVIGAATDIVLRPVLGRVGALRAIRVLSAAMGAGVVYFVYVAGYAVFGSSVGLTGAVFVLLIPMRAALAGGMTNENLAALAASGALATLTVALRNGFTPRRLVMTSFWITVGIGSKLTCLGLLPALAVALSVEPIRRRQPWKIALARLTAIAGTVLLGTGWWFARNQRLYGDPFRAAAANRLWDRVQPGFAVIGPQKHFTPLRYAISLLHWGWVSFWEAVDQTFLPSLVYHMLLVFQVIALAGLYHFAMSHWRLIRARAFILGMWAVYSLCTFAIYMQYNWRHFTPQGRYFFVLLVPFGVLTALGWRSIVGRGMRNRIATGIMVAFLLILNLWTLYAAPRRIGFHSPLKFLNGSGAH